MPIYARSSWLRTVAVVLLLVPAGALAQDADPLPLDDTIFGAPSPYDSEATGSMFATEFGDEEPVAEAEEPADTDAYAGEALTFSIPSLRGSTGMWHLSSALTPPEGAFGAGLTVGFFSTSDWLVTNDSDNFVGGDLGLWWSPLRYLQAFADLSAYANSNDMERPTLIQTLGDVRLGAKGYYPVVPWYALGGELSVLFLNQVGDVAVEGEATSVDLRFLNSFDFQRINASVPIQLHLNFSYFFDHSRNLIDETEAARAAAGDDPFITRVERFALNINRLDSFNFAVGLEGTHPAIEDWVRFGVEWNLAVPVNRSGIDYNCLQTRYRGDDSCLDITGAKAFPQTLTIGVRGSPAVRGLTLDAAVDVGLTGTETFAREVAPTPLWKVLLGLAYAFDLSDHEVPQECPPPPPPATIAGRVVEEGSQTPIPRAMITYVGREATGMVADGSGRFLSGPLEPGEYVLGVSADGYFEGRCNVNVQGPDSEVVCSLRPTPKIGTIVGRVLDAEGAPVTGVRITLTPAGRVEGAVPGPTVTGSDGGFTFEVPAGSYVVGAEHDEYFLRQKQVEVAPRARIEVEMTLAKKPRRAAVTVDAEQIRIRRQIHFETDSAVIKGDSFIILDEVADVMLRNPQIRRVEVQGHTDNRGEDDYNQRLSQSRAESVVQYLVDAGVDPRRLEARGYGESQPIAPNVTAAGRAKNRRVEFHIQDQSGGGGAGPSLAP